MAATDEYRPATLEAGGYVDCVAPERTVAVAEALFPGRDDLLAVCLDPDRLDAPVEYEGGVDGDGGLSRVRGPLNPDAVLAVVPVPLADDGTFSVPDGVRELR